MIASLSPSGRSAQLTTKPEKIRRGSALCDRGFASFFLATEEAIHSGLTMGIRAFDMASYSSKSMVVEMMWVTPFRGTLP